MLRIEESLADVQITAEFDSPGITSDNPLWVVFRRTVRRLPGINGGLARVEFNAGAMPVHMEIVFLSGKTIVYEIAHPSHSITSGGDLFTGDAYRLLNEMRDQVMQMKMRHNLLTMEIVFP